MNQYDGKALLRDTLKRAGYASPEAAIAEMALFANPDTVKNLGCKNSFRIIRGTSGDRGKIIDYNDRYKRVMICDNTTPADAFDWLLTDVSLGNDIQCNHIYQDSKNVEIYTSIANLCYTPSFLAKLTDTDKVIENLLRYRVYDIFGFLPPGQPKPARPSGYDNLKWRAFPAKTSDVERAYRSRMASCPKRRATVSAREIGWYFSGYLPDQRLRSAA